MKRRYIAYALAAFTGIIFSSCSNLFENVINEDFSFKAGDDSLFVDVNREETQNGLVVIKASEKNKNQIKYSAKQKNYFVGEVPEDFSDYTPDYKNGSNVTLTGKDGPVELRCFVNDVNAKVEWTLTQIWEYIPEYEDKSVTDSNGNQIVYRAIKAQHAEKLERSVAVSYSLQTKIAASFISADLPYGVTVADCRIIADDDYYKNEYKIILTKKFVDRGLMALSAQDYSLNKINFNPLQNKYEIKDINESDNAMKFRCYLSDSDNKIEWNLKQIAEFERKVSVYSKEITDPVLGTKEKVNYKYISGQTEVACDKDVEYHSTDFEDYDANEIAAEIPIGITEVRATIHSTNGESLSYKITLTRDLYKDTVSEKEFEEALENGLAIGDYSRLEDLEIKIVDEQADENSRAKLIPEFDSSISTYTLIVDEEADSIDIDAIAASEDVEISEPKVITKYGEVPAIEGMKINLVGGKSRVTFTVTDETMISRTYTLYVEKPEDGDTTLEKLDITPLVSFENGLALDHGLIKSYKGGSETDIAKYNMTLSADSRKDVSNVTFKAVPTNKRTVVSYGISDSYDKLPDNWSTEFKKANPASMNVILGDDDVSVITKVLWIKTVSDEYYHTTATGYASVKTADITYHKIQMTKAGNANKELTAVAIDVTYENGRTNTINLQTAKTEVAKKAENVITGIEKITTFADVVEIYFRPLDKDANLSYTIKNTENAQEKEILADVKYEKINGTCSKFNDGSKNYYKLTIGRMEDSINSIKDFPRGTTVVTIGGRTFTFTKPDIKNVTYKLGLGNGELKWSNYIYLKNEETSLNMTLNSEQQNQILSVKSCEYYKGANNRELTQAEITNTKVNYEITGPKEKTVWTNVVTNIPVGTTKLEINVKNNANEKSYTYYIVRADTTETRLKTLSFDGVTPKAFETDWKSEENRATYTYEFAKPFNVEAGEKILKLAPVNPGAYITTKKYQSTNGSLNNSEDESWTLCSGETKTGTDALSFTESFTETTASKNAGTSIKYEIKVSTAEGAEATHTYNVIIHVEADKTVQLDALKIIQKGETDALSRTILANSFKPEILEYKDLSASLNYKGDIVITPIKYAKASIVRTVLKCGEEEIPSENTSGIIFAVDGNITIPYSVYSEKLGKTYTVSYEVQAQDTTVPAKTYTAAFMIPEYKIITETTKASVTKNFSYDIPTGNKGGLGYRFGSVITAEGLQVKDFFGGIDIVGSSDGNNWYESSFGGSGLQFVLNIDGDDYWVRLDENGKLAALYTYRENIEPKEVKIPEGIDFEVKPQFVVEEEKQYLELEFVLTNSSGKTVKLGAAIDTLIGTLEEASTASNDRVKVVATNNGFVMKGNDYSFSMILQNAYGVDDVQKFWYGPYDSGNFLMKVFDENKISGLSENEDSAASFYWDIGDERESSKKIRISMEGVQ